MLKKWISSVLVLNFLFINLSQPVLAQIHDRDLVIQYRSLLLEMKNRYSDQRVIQNMDPDLLAKQFELSGVDGPKTREFLDRIQSFVESDEVAHSFISEFKAWKESEEKERLAATSRMEKGERTVGRVGAALILSNILFWSLAGSWVFPSYYPPSATAIGPFSNQPVDYSQGVCHCVGPNCRNTVFGVDLWFLPENGTCQYTYNAYSTVDSEPKYLTLSGELVSQAALPALCDIGAAWTHYGYTALTPCDQIHQTGTIVGTAIGTTVAASFAAIASSLAYSKWRNHSNFNKNKAAILLARENDALRQLYQLTGIPFLNEIMSAIVEARFKAAEKEDQGVGPHIVHL